MKLRQKLDWLEDLGDASNPKLERVPIVKSHDWVNLSDGTFDLMIPVCSTDRKANKNVGVVVSAHAQGVNTAADSYVYAFSKKALGERILDLLEEYDSARRRVHKHGIPITQATVNTPSSLHSIKWTDRLKQSLRSNQDIRFDEKRIREVLYRPFMKMWLYEDDRILNSVKTVSAMFPRPAELSESSTPPPQNSQSRRRATETSSRSSLSEDSSISTSSGRIKAEREAFPERDNSDKRRIKHDGSSAGYEPTTGLGVNPRFKTDKNAAQNESINNPTRGGGYSSPIPPTGPSLLSSQLHASAISAQQGKPADQMHLNETILITGPAKGAVFGMMATNTLPDLHLAAAGQQTRMLPRSKTLI